MPVRGKHVAGFVAALALFATCVWVAEQLLSGPSIESVAQKSIDCMVTGNGECVYDAIEENEKKALGLTPKCVDALLREYVLPSYGALDGPGAPQKIEIPSQGTVNVLRHWNGPQRKQVTLATFGVATPSGARTTCTTQWMIFYAMLARYKKSPGTPDLLVYVEGLERDSAKLDALGIHGVYDPQKKLVTKWPDLLAKYRREAAESGLVQRT